MIMYHFKFSAIFIAILCTKAFRISKESTKCDHQECKDYAQQIANSISLNTSVSPCSNFFEYSCGTWKSNQKPNPGQQLSSFYEQMANIRTNIKNILDGDADEKESSVAKAQTMYRHCNSFTPEMIPKEVNKITESLGGWPIVVGPSWSSDNFFSSFDEIMPSLAKFRLVKPMGVLFSLAVTPNIEDNSSPKLHILPPDVTSLPLPQEMSPADRVNYQQKLFQMAKRFNPEVNELQAQADAITLLQLNDLLNHLLNGGVIGRNQGTESQFTEYDITIKELSKLTKMDWIRFLEPLLEGIAHVEPTTKVEVGTSLAYLIRLSSYAESAFFSPRAVFNYELLNIVHDILLPFGPPLASGEQDNTNVLSTYISLPPDKSSAAGSIDCLKVTSDCYPYAMAWKYAELYHDVEKEVKVAKEMTENIFHIFGERMKTQDWIDKDSLKSAEQKIEHLKGYYVYPNWTDHLEKVNEYYGSIKKTEGFLQDFVSCRQMNFKEDLKDFAKVPHMQKWHIPPLMTNAYYFMLDNSMKMLEGIMQKPIFSPNRLKSMNYGALGSIIGHEITHGFDQIGVLFDKDGRLNPWMSESSRKEFESKAQCFKDQYSKYVLTKEDLPGSDGYTIDGVNTANENIADNGGMQQAYWALKKALQETSEEVPTSLKKFTPEQVFFLSYAQMWCTVYGNNPNWPAQLEGDTHCPPKFRVIGTLSNFDEFAKQFKCSAGDAMVKKDACHIW